MLYLKHVIQIYLEYHQKDNEKPQKEEKKGEVRGGRGKGKRKRKGKGKGKARQGKLENHQKKSR